MEKQTNINSTQDVTILMGLHNGAAHLAAQLASIASQTHSHWRLICSDDASTDTTMQILEVFSHQWPGRVKISTGPKTGFSDNYMSLIRRLPEETGYICFADQDDVWLPNKISRGLRLLSRFGSEPRMYCGRRTYWYPDHDRKITSVRMTRPFTLRNALIENIATGNTILLNQSAARLARTAALRTKHVFAHDWWLYLLLTATGGHVTFDNDTSAILYRQHQQNEIGAGKGVRAQIHRKRGVLKGLFSQRVDGNLKALETIEDMLTPQARIVCQNFASARKQPGMARLFALRDIGPYRQSKASTLGFWGAAGLGRV